MPINSVGRDRNCPSEDNNTCKFLFWNSGGLSVGKLEECKSIILEKNIDAFAIVEAGAISDNENLEKCELQAYQLYNLPRSRQISSGMIVGAKTSLSVRFKIIHHMNNNDKIEAVQLDVWKNKTKTKYIIIYNPPLNETSFLENIEIDENTIVVGDFNAPCTTWNYQVTNPVGEIVEDYANSNPLMLLEGVPSPYTFLSNRGKQSRPDLVFCHPDIYKDCTQKNIMSPSGLGHKVIIVTRNKTKSTRKEIKVSWNFKKAKWDKYTKVTERYFRNRKKCTQMDQENREINKILQDAAHECIPRGRVKKYSPFWTNKIKKLQSDRNKKRKKAEMTGLQYDLDRLKEAQENLSKEIVESKERKFREFAKSIDYRKDGSKAHGYFSSMCRKEKQQILNGPIVHNNKTYTEDKEKADIICKHLAKQSNASYKKIKIKKQEYRNDGKNPYNSFFLLYELNVALKKLKFKKSPGIDLIYPEFLKHLGPYGKKTILNLCNMSWKTSIPDLWRKAEVIPILKKGKDNSIVESYRPISLTCMTAKLMEHMVNRRLMNFLESEKLLSNNQAAFRRNRSTMDQIAYLYQNVKEGFNNKLSTLAVYVDFKAAFDKVWRKRLLQKLQNINTPNNMHRWIKNFLSQRFIRVRYNNKRSKYRQTRDGVPQGAVLSPTLFLILINDIAEFIQRKSEVHIKLFADDVVMWITHRDKNKMEEEMNKALKTLEDWTDRNGMLINSSKTTYDFYTTGHGKPEFNLQYKESKLRKDDNPVYLGMTMDKKMKGITQVERMCEAGKRRMKLLKRVAGVKWGAVEDTLATTYKTYVRPVLEYGNSLLTTAPRSVLSRLDKVQNQALRLITGGVKTTPVTAMEAKTGIPPLHARRNAAACCLHEKLVRLDNAFWDREPHESLKTHKTFITEAEELKSVLIGDVSYYNREDITTPNINVAALEVDCDLAVEGLDNRKSDYLHEELRALTNKHIHKKYPESEWLHVYTDGSAIPGEGKAGAGVYCRRFEISHPAGENGSNFDGETIAILKALEIVKDCKENKIVILSDSKSAIQALADHEEVENITQKCKIQIIKLNKIGKEIKFQWIPSHCNIYGNEKADYLAKQGSGMKQDPKALSYNAIKNHISSASKNKIQQKWKTEGLNKVWKNYTEKKLKGKKEYNRRVETAQFRLNTGHDLLGPHLKRMGLANDDLCRLCGNEKQDRKHLLTCPKLKDENDALPGGTKLEDRESHLYWLARSSMMA